MKLYYFFLKTNQYFSTGQTIWLDPYPDRPSSGVRNMQVTRPIEPHSPPLIQTEGVICFGRK